MRAKKQAPPAATRVVGYIRGSTQEQEITLDAQREKLEAYAKALDLNLVEVIVDRGQSASSLDRPGLRRALAMLKARKADGLLVTKLDRLTRRLRDLGELIDDYFRDQYSLFSVGDSIDTRTASGRLVLNILGSIAEWERETIAERTREALGQLRRQGVQLGAPRFGQARSAKTDKHGRRLVVDHRDELRIIARMLSLRADGASFRKIAARLREEGLKTKRGRDWFPSMVKAVVDRNQGAAA